MDDKLNDLIIMLRAQIIENNKMIKMLQYFRDRISSNEIIFLEEKYSPEDIFN